MDEGAEFVELNSYKYIDLEIEYDDYNLSAVGKIVRLFRLKEASDRLFLGIEFLKETPGNSDLSNLIEKLKNRQIDY